MRKGVEHLIETSVKDKVNTPAFETWLTESNLTVKALTDTYRYYYNCVKAGLPTEEIIDEIKKYDSDADRMNFILCCSWKNSKPTGDHFWKQEETKEYLLDIYDKNPELAYVYRAICFKSSIETIKEYNLSPLLNEAFDALEPYKGNYENPLIHQIFSLFPFEVNNAIANHLWSDFLLLQKNSFLYKSWMKGITIEPNIHQHYVYAYDEEKNGSQNAEKNYRQFEELIDTPKGTFNENIANYLTLDQYYDQYYNHTYYLNSEKIITIIKTIQEEKSICFQLYQHMVAKETSKRKTCIESEEKKFKEKLNLKYYDLNLINTFRELAGTKSFSVESPFTFVQFHRREDTLNILISQHSYCKRYFNDTVHFQNYENVYGEGASNELELFLTDSNALFYKTKGGKWVPLTLKVLSPYINNGAIREMMTFLAKQTNNHLLSDVINDMDQCAKEKSDFISPISYFDTVRYHNRKEYFLNNYKNAGIIRWNFNKQNINLSYMVIKALDKVALCDYGILQNTSKNMLKYIKRRQNESIIRFLQGYYLEKDPEYYNQKILSAHHEHLRKDIVFDYIRMCISSRREIILHYSPTRLREEHDHFLDNARYSEYLKRTKPFKVPKNSKFNQLRKILPTEFEWIKNRKRLINESIEMRHCVWSYFKWIGQDQCAIYSYFDETGKFDVSGNKEPKRYTIEFRYQPKSNQYIIHQIQTKYDRFGGELLERHIETLLYANQK